MTRHLVLAGGSRKLYETAQTARRRLLIVPQVDVWDVSHETNAQALDKMSNNNFHAMAVVDQDRRLMGIAEREELVSKLMLSLTQSSQRWPR